MKSFLVHVYVKRHQAASMQKLKSSANGIDVVLQVDFLKNASLQNQNEIQSCYWSHGQATIFTGYAWIKAENNDNDNLQLQPISESVVIVSDDLQHTKVAIYEYMTYSFTYLTTKYPEIKKLHVSSDGASSQFK